MNTLLQIALTKVKGIGPRLSRSLLSHCDSVEAIFSASKKQLLTIPGINTAIIDRIRSKEVLLEAEQELAFISAHHIDLLWIEDDRYPRRLRECDDAPLLLYYKGSESLNPPRTISIVGTRKATTYGQRICDELIEELKHPDIQIISGLAYGIDIYAHQTALRHDIPTLGILGHGLDRIYPAAHRRIAADMVSCGGLLTEFTSGTNPDRQNFPMRNRIIAGMADVTIVIEAASRGGALITAEIANTYNRDVCAFPGGIDQESSAGCNYLIKTNRAHLIRNAADLFYLMNWEQEQNQNQKSSAQLSLLPPQLSEEQEKIFQFLQQQNAVPIDEIAIHCALPQSQLAISLLELEMEGIILSMPGKVYKLHHLYQH
ncbi:DNA-processing protein DprA [Sphingobacterium spiritivorum]|uniref:DNA-processing protein DprA n=1 Tax=Sphingobacterium TaxID=28453 RepID=UPI0025D8A8BA|nr:MULTISPECIES: DNA-processing protein DprA [unclassified Sphingobacterium]